MITLMTTLTIAIKNIPLWNHIPICHIDVRILIVLSCVTERDDSVLWKTQYM